MMMKMLLNELVRGYKYLKIVKTGSKFVNLRNFRKFWNNLENFRENLRYF